MTLVLRFLNSWPSDYRPRGSPPLTPRDIAPVVADRLLELVETLGNATVEEFAAGLADILAPAGFIPRSNEAKARFVREYAGFYSTTFH